MITTVPLPSFLTQFLAKQPLPAMIGGKEVQSSGGETFITRDPGTDEILAEVCDMQSDDVDRAVNAASDAFANASWAGLPAGERCAMLLRLADEVERRCEIISHLEALDGGKVLAQAVGDVGNFVATTRYFAEMALHIERRSTLAVTRSCATRFFGSA